MGGGRKLIRLHFIVEGQTEETFVNRILVPALSTFGVYADARRIETGRRHGRLFRGGLVKYDHLARDVSLWMKQDQLNDSWFTTMVDLYRLPDDFPGYQSLARNIPARARAVSLEAAFATDLAQRLDSLPVSRRIVPHIQVHEFESLLFSDPTAFLSAFPNKDSTVDRLQAIRNQFGSPEDIDDGPTTAPSKRILSVEPQYEKAVAGPLIAQRIGLEKMRQECPHFNEWVTSLFALANAEGVDVLN